MKEEERGMRNYQDVLLYPISVQRAGVRVIRDLSGNHSPSVVSLTERFG